MDQSLKMAFMRAEAFGHVAVAIRPDQDHPYPSLGWRYFLRIPAEKTRQKKERWVLVFLGEQRAIEKLAETQNLMISSGNIKSVVPLQILAPSNTPTV